MTADGELLPLPDDLHHHHIRMGTSEHHAATQTYARACVEANTEALRRDRDDCLAAREHYAGKFAEQHGRAERLEEALRFARTRFAPYMDDTDRAAFDAALAAQPGGDQE